jgi:hypothetical protein
MARFLAPKSFYLLSPKRGTSSIRVHVPCTKVECSTTTDNHDGRTTTVIMTNEPSNHIDPTRSWTDEATITLR